VRGEDRGQGGKKPDIVTTIQEGKKVIKELIYRKTRKRGRFYGRRGKKKERGGGERSTGPGLRTATDPPQKLFVKRRE